MTTLKHAIKIKAPRAAVYRALTKIEGVAGWHLGAVTGEIAIGSDFYLQRSGGLRFGWRTEQLQAGERIVQHCIEGPGSSKGKLLTISLRDDSDGKTAVELNDAGWDDADPRLPSCNTYWAEALVALREYVEHQAA